LKDLIKNSWHFSRPDLAKSLTSRLTDPLFSRIALLGARRIGKTMFILRDLSPALSDSGCIPIYISMWANKNAPHKEMINKLNQTHKILAKKSTLSEVLNSEITKLAVAGINLEFKKNDSAITILDDELILLQNLLRDIIEKSKGKRVVLLLDEIQHLISDKNFSSFQYGLRTILDELNENISVLYTGSSRAGMKAMFNNKDMPFYNSANQSEFPLLNMSFISFCTTKMHEQYNLSYNSSEMFDFFNSVNSSPYWIIRLVRHLVMEQRDLKSSIQYIKGIITKESDFDNLLDELTLIEKIVFVRINRSKSLYSKEAYLAYKKYNIEATRSSILNAIKKIKNKRLITKVGSSYLIEEAGFIIAVEGYLTKVEVDTTL